MEFYVKPETFGGVGDLHYSRNSAIVIRVSSHEIRTATHNHVHMGFQTSNVLELKQWCPNQLAQFAVTEIRNASVPKGVLEPKVAVFITHPRPTRIASPKVLRLRSGSNIESVEPPDSFANGAHDRDMLVKSGIGPRVNLEPTVAKFSALLGKVGVGFWRVKAPSDTVAHAGTCVPRAAACCAHQAAEK